MKRVARSVVRAMLLGGLLLVPALAARAQPLQARINQALCLNNLMASAQMMQATPFAGGGFNPAFSPAFGGAGFVNPYTPFGGGFANPYTPGGAGVGNPYVPGGFGGPGGYGYGTVIPPEGFFLMDRGQCAARRRAHATASTSSSCSRA